MELEVNANERSNGDGAERGPLRSRVKCRDKIGPKTIGVLVTLVMALGAIWLCFLLQDSKQVFQVTKTNGYLAGATTLRSLRKRWTHMKDSPWGDQNMTNAIGRLYQLQRAMAADHKPRPYESWYSWLTNGSWMQILTKAGTMLGAGLLTFFCLLICVIPCIRMMVTRATNALALVSGLTLQMEPVKITTYTHVYDDIGMPIYDNVTVEENVN